MNLHIAGLDVARWEVMWLLALMMYLAAKVLSGPQRSAAVPAWKQAVYYFAWPGMDAATVFGGNVPARCQARFSEWVFAALKFGFGLVILAWLVPKLANANSYLVGWVGMVGVVFILHFGLFHLLSCGCRRLGLMATPIMNWPIASQSVAEFWGQRWNRAFRDLTHRFLFLPLNRRLGPAITLMAGFLASGLAHEVVISIPAGGGFGLPTCYFSLQGLAILAERTRAGRSLGLGHGALGRLFCLLAVAAPCALLFHPPFVCRVFVPFLAALGLVPCHSI